MKKILVIVWLVGLLSAISYLFWFNEWKYSLPTPVPKQHVDLPIGTHLDPAKWFDVKEEKPTLIHFFNPDCPCSRFNMKHFKSLVKHYNKELSFAVVVLCKEGAYSAKDIRDKFDLDLPISFDGSIAKAYGVYSTPQAVLLDQKKRLYYKGNYNKSRYCTEKNSNYAQMAIDSLLGNHYRPQFNHYALKAYGCELPVCTK